MWLPMVVLPLPLVFTFAMSLLAGVPIHEHEINHEMYQKAVFVSFVPYHLHEYTSTGHHGV